MSRLPEETSGLYWFFQVLFRSYALITLKGLDKIA